MNKRDKGCLMPQVQFFVRGSQRGDGSSGPWFSSPACGHGRRQPAVSMVLFAPGTGKNPYLFRCKLRYACSNL